MATGLGSTGPSFSSSLLAVANLSPGSPALRLCARELAYVIATDAFAPDIVQHISCVSNVIPDLLSRRLDLPTSHREVT